MADMQSAKSDPKVHWKKGRSRPTRITFTCQGMNEVYLSFDWNGTYVWEYACTAGGRDGKAFAKLLRTVAALVEKAP